MDLKERKWGSEEMVKEDKRHYWIVCLDDYDVDWDAITIREIRDTFVRGLARNIHYISVINRFGENMYGNEGHKTEDLKDEPWIEVFDEDGNLDIEESANRITKDFLENTAIIVMRFDSDLYDELGKDCSWIDDILEEEE